MGRRDHEPLRRVHALAWVLLAACAESAPPAVDAGFDGVMDSSVDASVEDAGGGDAGPGVCGGHDRLEVVATNRDGTTDLGVVVFLRCGTITVQRDAAVDGHVTFDGLDLANQPVDVTALNYLLNSPIETHLDVDETSGGRLDVVLQTNVDRYVGILLGSIERSEPGSVAMLWMPYWYSVVDGPTYEMLPFDLDPLRLTAIEYRIEDDGIVPLAFVDRTFPPPPFEELPLVTFEAGATFETASVELIFEDERLFERWVPGPLDIQVPVVVFDWDPSDDFMHSAQAIGITTRNDPADGADRVEVSWWPEVQGLPVTHLQAVDPSFRVLSAAQIGATPDGLQSFVMPSPPGLSGISPDVVTDLDGLEVKIERPEWLGGGEAHVEVWADLGLGPELRWRVHPGRGRDLVRFLPFSGHIDEPLAGGRGPLAQAWLKVVAGNWINQNDGPSLYGEDGRFPVDVH